MLDLRVTKCWKWAWNVRTCKHDHLPLDITPRVVNDNVANYSPLVKKQWPLEGGHGNLLSLKSGGSFYSFSKGGGRFLTLAGKLILLLNPTVWSCLLVLIFQNGCEWVWRGCFLATRNYLWLTSTITEKKKTLVKWQKQHQQPLVTA